MLISLLPYLCTIHPDGGSAAKAPRGNENKIAPSSASSKPKESLKEGMRDAQVENIKPNTKK